ncbi:MAG: IclR family transcriptional regulator [Syntrophobacteraceae bacterium]
MDVHVDLFMDMDSTTLVKSARRTLDVFEVFAKAGGVLPLAALARMLDIPRSSCFALLRTLASRGYLWQTGTSGYYPTRKLYIVAETIARCDPLIDRVLPVMTALRDQTKETVILGKRQDDQVIYLAVVESEQMLRYSARPGDFKPLHGSASGKVLLAALPEEERHALLERLQLTHITPRTITSIRALEHDLHTGLARGWQYVEGENVPDVIAIAAPVDLNGEIYALVIAGSIPRMKDRLDEAGIALIGAARCLESSRSTGYNATTSRGDGILGDGEF